MTFEKYAKRAIERREEDVIENCIGLSKLQYGSSRELETITRPEFIKEDYDLYRMATIDDNHDLFHAILTLLSPRYLVSSDSQKVNMAKSLRKNLATKLGEKCPGSISDREYSCWYQSYASAILDDQMVELSKMYRDNKNITSRDFPEPLELPQTTIDYFDSNNKFMPEINVNYFYTIASLLNVRLVILDMCEQGTGIYIISPNVFELVSKGSSYEEIYPPNLLIGVTQNHYEAIWPRSVADEEFHRTVSQENLLAIKNPEAARLRGKGTMLEPSLQDVNDMNIWADSIWSEYVTSHSKEYNSKDKKSFNDDIAKVIIETYIIPIALARKDPEYREFLREDFNKSIDDVYSEMKYDLERGGLDIEKFDPKMIGETLLGMYDSLTR